MTKVVVVTSGKGGVGKTTTSASFSAGLALRGFKTAVIDFDVGLRNLDLIMGCERRVVYEPVHLNQEYRDFDFLSPWEGMQLPQVGDDSDTDEEQAGA